MTNALRREQPPQFRGHTLQCACSVGSVCQHESMSNTFPPNEVDPAQQPGADQSVPTGPEAPPAYGPPANGYATSTPAAPAGKNGLGLAAVIIGAVALLLAFIPVVNVFAVVLAVVGVILGAIGLAKKAKPKTLALIGTILSGVAAILAIIMIVVYAVMFVQALDKTLPAVGASEEAVPAAEEPEEESAGSGVGSRNNPAPLGTTVTMTVAGADTWEITPGPANLNAGDLVAAANQFNDAAPDGYQWAILPLHLTYVGADSSTPIYDIEVTFVGADGTTYEEYNELASGYVDGELNSLNEMYTGASGDGNVLILVPSADLELGTWSISPSYGDPYFFKAQ